MLSLEKLRAVKTLVVHKNCPDGLASEMILRTVLPDVTTIYLQYNTPETINLVPTPGMLFCDFSPSAEKMQAFIDEGTMVLDHHKTAKDIVAAFGDNGVFGDETLEPGVSGAVLAFREVFIPLGAHFPHSQWNTIGEFARKAGIRDTWQRKDPEWKEACDQAAAVMFWPKETWLNTPPERWAELAAIGPVLTQKHGEKIQKALGNSYRFVSDFGTRVVMFQGVSSSSDANEAITDQADLVIGFSYFNDGSHDLGRQGMKIVYSTRSSTHFNCAKMAQQNNGGGHTRAAGFGIPVQSSDPNPFTMLTNILRDFESMNAVESIMNS